MGALGTGVAKPVTACALSISLSLRHFLNFEAH